MIAVTESLLSLRHSSDLGTLSKTLQVLNTYIHTYISYTYICVLGSVNNFNE
jgi:hypothetical protein